ncbi:MAG: hypothetical protein IT212_07300 [Bacteroidia bacterium]|nr:hypothetical protein [Bacteroidia bacterium]
MQSLLVKPGTLPSLNTNNGVCGTQGAVVGVRGLVMWGGLTNNIRYGKSCSILIVVGEAGTCCRA